VNGQEDKRLRLIVTGDGSHSLLDPALNETYHSRHGALAESQHVFIEAGLLAAGDRARTNVLEIGLGTGLNALLTARAVALRPGLCVSMISLEPRPLPVDIAAGLNYPDLLPDFPEAAATLARIHEAPWDQAVALGPRITLRKLRQRFEAYDGPAGSVDALYFDAFAPNKQADIWAPANLERARRLLRSDGFLVTYCARGQFKRDLLMAGFSVEPLPGPPGKREMTRARPR